QASARIQSTFFLIVACSKARAESDRSMGVVLMVSLQRVGKQNRCRAVVDGGRPTLGSVVFGAALPVAPLLARGLLGLFLDFALRLYMLKRRGVADRAVVLLAQFTFGSLPFP